MRLDNMIDRNASRGELSSHKQKTVSLGNMIDRNASTGWLASHKQKTVSLDNMIDRNASRSGGFRCENGRQMCMLICNALCNNHMLS